MKPNQTEIEAAYQRLASHLKDAEQVFQKVGLDIKFLRQAGQSYRQLSARLGYPKSTLESYYRAFEVAPTASDLHVDGKTGTYAHALTAAQVARRLKRSAKGVSAREVFEVAVRDGLSTRELRRVFERQYQKEELNRLAAFAAAGPSDDGWSNSLHKGCCVEIASQIPDQSIDFAFLDPPYWPYGDVKGDGGLRQDPYSGTVLDRCANRTMTESKARAGIDDQQDRMTKRNGAERLRSFFSRKGRAEQVNWRATGSLHPLESGATGLSLLDGSHLRQTETDRRRRSP